MIFDPVKSSKDLGGPTLKLDILMYKTTYKIINHDMPDYLSTMFKPRSSIHNYDLRGCHYNLGIPLPKTNFFKRSFLYNGAVSWNSLQLAQ
jgi:hypothetical protein